MRLGLSVSAHVPDSTEPVGHSVVHRGRGRVRALDASAVQDCLKDFPRAWGSQVSEREILLERFQIVLR